MNRLVFSCLVVFGLTGCKSEEPHIDPPRLLNIPEISQPKIEPIPKPERKIIGGNSFSLGPSKVLAHKAGGTLRDIERQKISYAIDASGSKITLRIGKHTYDLIFSSSDSRYKFTDGRNSASSLRVFAATNSLETIYAAHTRLNAAGTSIRDASAFFQPIGFLSGADVANRQSGAATYNGQINVVSSSATSGPSFGKGNLSLNVNFDTDKLSGGAALVKTSTKSLPIKRIDIPETSFRDGLASGAITVVTADSTQTLENGEFDAALYGSRAKGIGGTVSGVIKTATGDPAHTFQGAFATSR